MAADWLGGLGPDCPEVPGRGPAAGRGRQELPAGRMDTTHVDGFDMPHCGLVYDAKLDVVFCNDIRRQQVWAPAFSCNLA